MAQHRFGVSASRRAILAGLGAGLGAAALAAPARAQTKPETKPAPKRGNPAKETAADLSDEALFQRHQIPAGAVGYLAVDGKTGQVLQSRAAAEPFVPASSIKIASTAAALVVLGANHRFATTWLTTGAVADGVLKGDLILKGGGDPLLDSDHYADAAQRLKQLGIRRVAGRFVYDSSDFATVRAIDGEYEGSDGLPPGPIANPGLAALSVNFNRLKLKWERGKAPDAIAVTFKDACGNLARGLLRVELDNTPPEAVITYPKPTDPLTLMVEIVGSVSDLHFSGYTVTFGESHDPATWAPIGFGSRAVAENVLATWNTNGLSGAVTLRLVAKDAAFNESEVRVLLNLAERTNLVTYLEAAPRQADRQQRGMGRDCPAHLFLPAARRDGQHATAAGCA